MKEDGRIGRIREVIKECVVNEQRLENAFEEAHQKYSGTFEYTYGLGASLRESRLDKLIGLLRQTITAVDELTKGPSRGVK